MNEQINENSTTADGIHIERGFNYDLPKCPARNCLRTLPPEAETRRAYRGRDIYGWRFWQWGDYKLMEQSCACGFERGRWVKL